MKPSHVLILAGGLFAAATASFAAQTSETIGDKLGKGEMSQRQFEQLVPFTGLTPAQAKNATLDQVVAKRWQQS